MDLHPDEDFNMPYNCDASKATIHNINTTAHSEIIRVIDVAAKCPHDDIFNYIYAQYKNNIVYNYTEASEASDTSDASDASDAKKSNPIRSAWLAKKPHRVKQICLLLLESPLKTTAIASKDRLAGLLSCLDPADDQTFETLLREYNPHLDHEDRIELLRAVARVSDSNAGNRIYEIAIHDEKLQKANQQAVSGRKSSANELPFLVAAQHGFISRAVALGFNVDNSLSKSESLSRMLTHSHTIETVIYTLQTRLKNASDPGESQQYILQITNLYSNLTAHLQSTELPCSLPLAVLYLESLILQFNQDSTSAADDDDNIQFQAGKHLYEFVRTFKVANDQKLDLLKAYLQHLEDGYFYKLICQAANGDMELIKQFFKSIINDNNFQPIVNEKDFADFLKGIPDQIRDEIILCLFQAKKFDIANLFSAATEKDFNNNPTFQIMLAATLQQPGASLSVSNAAFFEAVHILLQQGWYGVSDLFSPPGHTGTADFNPWLALSYNNTSSEAIALKPQLKSIPKPYKTDIVNAYNRENIFHRLLRWFNQGIHYQSDTSRAVYEYFAKVIFTEHRLENDFTPNTIYELYPINFSDDDFIKSFYMLAYYMHTQQQEQCEYRLYKDMQQFFSYFMLLVVHDPKLRVKLVAHKNYKEICNVKYIPEFKVDSQFEKGTTLKKMVAIVTNTTSTVMTQASFFEGYSRTPSTSPFAVECKCGAQLTFNNL